MTLPELDWPTDLFADEVFADEARATDASELGSSLWVMMRQVWVRLTTGIDRPGVAT